MKDRRRMLKVKIKSLAAEAAIIRREERLSKPGSDMQNELHCHRVREVRTEQRNSLLAYAFIRNRPLELVERHAKKERDWPRIAKLVEKFGVVSWGEDRKEQAARFAEWKASAMAVV